MGTIGRALSALAVVVAATTIASIASFAETLEATIFSFDGSDFVRTNTTLMDKGQSAENTKLDHSSAAYKALMEKHSYTGQVTVFGKTYDSRYAPLIGDDGKLNGAVFVGIPK